MLSGGSIYVSDAPGQHNVALLRRLVLPDGTILRALRPGRPTRDTIFRDVLRDGESLLKVRHLESRAGAYCKSRHDLSIICQTIRCHPARVPERDWEYNCASRKSFALSSFEDGTANDGTDASAVQVWNVNRYSGIVGTFHLQGASWSRTRRQFLVHDETPPPLATQVRLAMPVLIRVNCRFDHKTMAVRCQPTPTAVLPRT